MDCFNLSKLIKTEFLNELSSQKDFKILKIKLNKIKPEAQAKIQDGSSKIPWGIINTTVLKKSSFRAT